MIVCDACGSKKDGEVNGTWHGICHVESGDGTQAIDLCWRCMAGIVAEFSSSHPEEFKKSVESRGVKWSGAVATINSTPRQSTDKATTRLVRDILDPGPAEPETEEASPSPDLSRFHKNPVERKMHELQRRHGCQVHIVILPGQVEIGSHHSYGSKSNPAMIEVLGVVSGKTGQYYAKTIG